MPKVSVIIPTYNYGKYIKKAIDSVLNQTFKDFEIIVVDDGSTDNTKAIIQTKYKNKIRYYHQKNLGAPKARNKGIKESEGKYVAFLDADDWFMKDNLEKKVKIIEGSPEIHWVYSDWMLIDLGGNIIGKASKIFGIDHLQLNSKLFESLLTKGNFISTCVSLITKECLTEISGFDETLQALQDYDLNLRLGRNLSAMYIDEPLVFTRIHSDSISGSIYKALYARLDVINKIRNIFPEEANRYKNELIKTEANIYNYLGIYHLKKKGRVKSLPYFLKSVRKRPIQKKAYELILKVISRVNKNKIIDKCNYTVWNLYDGI